MSACGVGVGDSSVSMGSTGRAECVCVRDFQQMK